MGETSLAKEYLIKGEKEGANIDTKKGTVSLGEKELFKRTETQKKLMEQQEKQTLAKEKTVIEKVGGGTGEFEASKILSAMKDNNFDNTGKMEISIDGNNYQIWNNSETIVRLQCYMISQGADIGTYKSGEKMIDGDFGNSNKNALNNLNLNDNIETGSLKRFDKIKNAFIKSGFKVETLSNPKIISGTNVITEIVYEKAKEDDLTGIKVFDKNGNSIIISGYEIPKFEDMKQPYFGIFEADMTKDKYWTSPWHKSNEDGIFVFNNGKKFGGEFKVFEKDGEIKIEKSNLVYTDNGEYINKKLITEQEKNEEKDRKKFVV